MALLRSILVFLWMALTVIVPALAIVISAPFTQPETRWWYLARPWLRGAVAAAKYLGKIDYKVKGESSLPTGEDNQRIILCPKHQSTWETFFLASRMPHPLAYVFKRELLYVPFFGWAMACLDMIHIDRKARGDAWNKVALMGQVLMDRGKWVIMFPEGTRSARGQQGVYRTGAARLAIATGASIIPIAVSSARCWPRKTFIFLRGSVTVSVGPPISARPGESAGELMGKVEAWIEAEMRVIDSEAYPVSELSSHSDKNEAVIQETLERQAAGARAAHGEIGE